MESISNNKYEHPQQVWNTMEKIPLVAVMALA